MLHTFLIVGEKRYKFDQLLNDLNEMTSYNSYVYVLNNEPYDIFLHIIHSLIYDYELTIVDGDFSKGELHDLNINEADLNKKQELKSLITIDSLEELIFKIERVTSWQLTLFTSGTTGRPRQVSHSFQTLTRNVKQGDKYKENVWAFAYNPTHMAGLQVFFQAFLNLNPIVYMFNVPFKQVAHLLKRYEITNISATPTFYRHLMPYIKDESFKTINYVTLGGEKYDITLESELNNLFPNARLRNIYAATETGSLFTADGDIFTIPHTLRDFIKISDQNELLIHQKLLGHSDAFQLQDNWYYTGDLVHIVDESRFKFVSRKSDIINVGGYNVNPLEVETVLKEIRGIKDIVVKSRKNRVIGEMVVADVVKEEGIDGKTLKKEIKRYGSLHLQQWKVPRIITFVEDISMTRTGKKVRK